MLGVSELTFEQTYIRACSATPVSIPGLPDCIQIWQNRCFQNRTKQFWWAPVLKPKLLNGPLLGLSTYGGRTVDRQVYNTAISEHPLLCS